MEDLFFENKKNICAFYDSFFQLFVAFCFVQFEIIVFTNYREFRVFERKFEQLLRFTIKRF